jgi:hypothetical protein
MKIEIAQYVAQCDLCRRVKAVHLKTAGQFNPLHILSWKWDDISMDFIVGLPRTSKGFDSIWVIVDRLTKQAHFLPVKNRYPALGYAKLYINRILSLQECLKQLFLIEVPNLYCNFGNSCINPWVTKLIHSSAYQPQTVRQTKRVNQILEDMLRACVLNYSDKWDECLPLAKLSYNNSY